MHVQVGGGKLAVAVKRSNGCTVRVRAAGSGGPWNPRELVCPPKSASQSNTIVALSCTPRGDIAAGLSRGGMLVWSAQGGAARRIPCDTHETSRVEVLSADARTSHLLMQGCRFGTSSSLGGESRAVILGEGSHPLALCAAGGTAGGGGGRSQLLDACWHESCVAAIYKCGALRIREYTMLIASGCWCSPGGWMLLPPRVRNCGFLRGRQGCCDLLADGDDVHAPCPADKPCSGSVAATVWQSEQYPIEAAKYAPFSSL